jgi:peroxiredoxin
VDSIYHFYTNQFTINKNKIMKNKIVLYSIICLVVASFLYMINRIRKEISKKELAEVNRREIPQFSYHTYTGITITKDSLMKNVPSIFIYFHPECDHCQNEILSIKKEMCNLSNFNLMLVSPASKETIDSHVEFQVSTFNRKVYILKEENNNFSQDFGLSTFPSTIIYNKYNKLVKVFSGEVNLSILKKSLI